MSVPGACDLLPSCQVDLARADLEGFLADDLRCRIGQYFGIEITLYWMVRQVQAVSELPPHC